MPGQGPASGFGLPTLTAGWFSLAGMKVGSWIVEASPGVKAYALPQVIRLPGGREQDTR